MTMRTATQSTIAKIAALSEKPSRPAWLRATIHDALSGKAMSADRERRLCEALGIQPPPVEYSIPACPGCNGEPHTGSCNGQPVAAVVVLSPGQRVTTPRPRRYSRIDQMPVADLARAIRDRGNLHYDRKRVL